MDLAELLRMAVAVHDKYDQLNLRDRGRVWSRSDYVNGFMGDVGDLAKIVMVEEGLRQGVGGRTALEHELADCLWSVLILAYRYDVDLESAFGRTMSELDETLTAQLGKDAPPQVSSGELGKGSVGA
ncbi:MazG nucleotide pyrophosphohydrolase domain-containing protein [Streptomyces sp. CL12-4]|uniref:MazG nucleotide pyrophosphohydrolase domain-containing protein n=1 Tax=Streptomyces sp. CL12-4 TaxID=2810306 RepID=UPI001EFB48B1|nr:MazG nucleotide pyrophosphohydrolase domain-containing protein [Streptomyces sp. CL12-4]MCG8971450.1 nucleotide pyrophosphohydrolase [Streptomyces sp. CL12-4]